MGPKMNLLLTIQVCLHLIVSRGANNKNLALNKPTQELSIFGGTIVGNSNRAVDGNRDSLYRKGSCSHTLTDYPAWWLVDLQAAYVITSVQITNREHASQRLANFSVEVSLTHPTQLAGFPSRTESPTCVKEDGQLAASETRHYPCEKPILGRYVTLVKFNEKETDRPLTICEFEVFGYLPEVKFKPSGCYKAVPNVLQAISGVRSKLECAKLCAHYPEDGCLSFQMCVTTGVCELLGSLPGQEKAVQSDWISYQAVYSMDKCNNATPK